ncbi:MAG: Arc family DNA-binding protein [Roseinatronobacter sp.]
MQDSPSQSQDKFIIRLPDGMRDRIKSAADSNNRSMNAEIVATLEKAYPAPVMPPDMQLLADYMHLIESAESDEQQAEFLRSANESLKQNAGTAPYEIRIGSDPDGYPALYVTKRKG